MQGINNTVNINAALKLGDLNFLNEDFAWLEQLLRHYSLPDKHLQRYLNVYYQAAKDHLSQPGQPIIKWLAQLIEEQ